MTTGDENNGRRSLIRGEEAKLSEIRAGEHGRVAAEFHGRRIDDIRVDPDKGMIAADPGKRGREICPFSSFRGG